MKNIFTYLFIIFISHNLLQAQESTNNLNINSGAVNVFMDGCWDCDFDNFRRQLKYVNFMRTRQEADVYILVTDQNMGNGGEKFTLYFEGQMSPYQKMYDTIFLFTTKDDSDRIISDKLLISFKKGIIPYVLKSSLADKISFNFNVKEDSSTDKKDSIVEYDPWDSWLFSVSGSGNFNGESSYDGLSLNGRISANRVTEKNKISFRSGFNYRKNNFHLITYDSLGNETERESFESLRRSQYGSAEFVNSITTHWSSTIELYVNTNTFSNLDFGGSLRAGIEYNYFPYSESDRRSLTFVYKIGPSYNDYVDSTIYNQLKELLWQQSFEVDLAQKQKWGSVYLGISYRGYIHDFNLYRLSFNPNIDWNISKGLTLGLGGYASLIGDQITLPKGSIDVPDLLLKNIIQATKFSYWGYFRIRYTFGSDYNNVVNPRFNGGRSGNFFF